MGHLLGLPDHGGARVPDPGHVGLGAVAVPPGGQALRTGALDALGTGGLHRLAVPGQHGRLDLHRDGAPALDRVRPDEDRAGRVAHCLSGRRGLHPRRLRPALHGARGHRRYPHVPVGPPRSQRGPASSRSAGGSRRSARRGTYLLGADHQRASAVRGPVASLNTVWFALIGVLWTGYFVLEGFDFGVGMLSLAIGRDDTDRRMARSAIGPWWDGNEVWLIVAGGATFAAFPLWYASMFSGFYLPLFVILAALIIRGVSFEFRGKQDSARWKAGWDWALAIGSLVPAFAWGVAFTALVRGLGLPPAGLYLGGLSGLMAPVAIVGGLASLTLFLAHGATFLSFKTSGPLAGRARTTAMWMSPLAALLVAGTPAWLSAGGSHRPGYLHAAVPIALAAGCGLAFVIAAMLVWAHWEGAAFALSALGIVAAVGAIFTTLFPRVMVSSGPGPSLTIWNAASANETLVVMTVVAAIFVPLVLAYQGWSYWVFRQRLVRPAGQPASVPPPRPHPVPGPHRGGPAGGRG